MLRNEATETGIIIQKSGSVVFRVNEEKTVTQIFLMELLKKIDLFAEISEEGLTHLMQCSKAKVKTFEKGQFVFQENEVPKYIYVLLEGKCLMTKHGSSGRRSIFCEIHEREVFGILIHIWDKETYWYDAETMTECSVLCLPWDFLFGICARSCEVHKTLIKNMVRVQADISVSQMKKLHILSGTSVEAKIGLLMLELMDEDGMVDLKMNREELADFLGITRPSLSRSLMKLKQRGLISVARSKVKILDLERLEEVCIQ